MFPISVVQGGVSGGPRESGVSRGRAGAQASVRRAIGQGFRVGSQVRIGAIAGEVIGYNIACVGRYPGLYFPLLVATALGVAKCNASEAKLS